MRTAINPFEKALCIERPDRSYNIPKQPRFKNESDCLSFVRYGIEGEEYEPERPLPGAKRVKTSSKSTKLKFQALLNNPKGFKTSVLKDLVREDPEFFSDLDNMELAKWVVDLNKGTENDDVSISESKELVPYKDKNQEDGKVEEEEEFKANDLMPHLEEAPSVAPDRITAPKTILKKQQEEIVRVTRAKRNLENQLNEAEKREVEVEKQRDEVKRELETVYLGVRGGEIYGKMIDRYKREAREGHREMIRDGNTVRFSALLTSPYHPQNLTHSKSPNKGPKRK